VEVGVKANVPVEVGVLVGVAVLDGMDPIGVLVGVQAGVFVKGAGNGVTSAGGGGEKGAERFKQEIWRKAIKERMEKKLRLRK
jgi:hypothetical protein